MIGLLLLLWLGVAEADTVTLLPGQSITVTAGGSPGAGCVWDYSKAGTWILNQQGQVWPNQTPLDLSPWVPVTAQVIRVNLIMASYWASPTGYVDASAILGVPGAFHAILGLLAGTVSAGGHRVDVPGAVLDLPNVNLKMDWGLQGSTLVYGANMTVQLLGVCS